MNRWAPSDALLARLDELFRQPEGRRLGLLGFGVAGTAMAEVARSRGFEVVVADHRDDLATGDFPQRRLQSDVFDDCDGVLISPGADPRQPLIQRTKERGTPVFGELELLGPLPRPSVGITGTNGKSTTTAWLGHVLRASGHRAFVGGNLGVPLSRWSEECPDAEFLVAELSSFQLETAYRARFSVAIVLNVTPDHGERYDRFEDYAAAKARLVENLTGEDTAILNADDPTARAMETDARVLWFSSRGTALPGEGLVAEDGVARGLGALDGFSLRSPHLPGRHNTENSLAVVLAAFALGVDPILGLETFSGLPDRLEFVAEVAGVRYVNDTKATNDEAAATAVNAMQGPVILLCGGVEKGGGYAKLSAASAGRVRLALCYGEAGGALAAALGSVADTRRPTGFAAAFEQAVAAATSGDTVLLAPACSSFDEFENYAARGEAFRTAVRGLGGGQ